MGKFFNTSEDVIETISNKINEMGLNNYGITFKIMSTNKSKEIIKVSKASPATEFLTKKDSIIQICVYEAAFDRLTDDAKDILVEMALSNISYDLDKDKLTVESNPFIQLFNTRKKYGENVLDKLELSYLIIKEIEEEEKERKQAEKENKKIKLIKR